MTERHVVSDEPRHSALAHGLVSNPNNADRLIGLFADAERINDMGLLDNGKHAAAMTTAYHDVCDTIEEMMRSAP
jgi:hypothetical protein